MYRSCPARARRGRGTEVLPALSADFLAEPSAIGTRPRSHWAVRCRTTTLWPSSHLFTVK